MPAVAGQGTTFNLPNFTGEIINVSPLDTPFLTAIAGVTAQNFEGSIGGAVPVNAVLFDWSLEDLRDAADDRQRLEGADAPAAEERSLGNAFNVVEIHQETLELSYTKLAAVGQFAATGANHPNAQGLATGPAASERMRQMRVKWREMARDIEASFVTGTFQEPANNATARKTRGIIAATVTNVVNNAPAAALTKTMVDTLLQQVWAAGGISEQETATLMCGGAQKLALSKLYLPEGREPRSRDVGGVNVETIVTDFGELNVMLSRYMPADTIQVVSLEQCRPRVLNIPDKGVGFFAEPLAKTGSAEKTQFYGEIGLEYGNELAHGKITGLT